jgi:hypothetical protein
MRYRPALRDVSGLAKQIAAERGGLLPYAERVVSIGGQNVPFAHIQSGA